MPRGRKPDDLKLLQGSWSIVELEIDGRKMPAAGARIVVNGSTFVTGGMGDEYEGAVTLDPSSKPKTFDLIFTSGPEKGNTNRGIYELDGETWKICLDMTGGKRPAAFASGSGVALEVLRRGAAEAPATVPAAIEGELPRGGPTEDIEGEWQLISAIREGMEIPSSMARSGKRVATANEITVTLGPQVIVKAKYSVNREAQPNTIDYLTADGRQYGIFCVENGQLKTCFAPVGQPRPADFRSDASNRYTLTEWRKIR